MKKYSFVQEKIPGSQVELDVKIDHAYLTECRKKALEKISKEVELQGFRKGHAPESILVQKIGESKIMEEAAQIAINSLYQEILNEAKIEAIGEPSIQITKLAIGNPLEIKMIFTVYPDVKLADYKKISKEIMSGEKKVDVSEKEIEDVITEIRKQHAHVQMHKNLDNSDHSHKPIKESDLAPLTDETVKEFGDFKNISDLKNKIEENLLSEKKFQARDKKRTELIEKISQDSEMELPEILVEHELQKLTLRFKGDIERAGLTYETYLKSIGKNENDLRKDWRKTAEKNAKAQIVLGRIAEKEKLSPDKNRLEEECKQIIQNYKEADPVRVKMYVATMLLNEKVIEFLENQK